MIKKQGNVFESTAPALAHGVNCVGVMGAGIAVEFKNRWPEMYDIYKEACDNNMLTGGSLMPYRAEAEDWWIYNMATQYLPGANAEYKYIRWSAWQAARHALDNDVDRIALPMIGCGIGGLVWPEVEATLKMVEAMTGIEFEVWKF